jgi:hypothetical protein
MGDIRLLEILNEGTNNLIHSVFCDVVAGIRSFASRLSLANYYTTNLGKP